MADGAKHVMLEANGMALNAVDMGVQDMPAIVLLAGWPQRFAPGVSSSRR